MFGFRVWPRGFFETTEKGAGKSGGRISDNSIGAGVWEGYEGRIRRGQRCPTGEIEASRVKGGETQNEKKKRERMTSRRS